MNRAILLGATLAAVFLASTVSAQTFGQWSVSAASPKAVIVDQPASAQNVLIHNDGPGKVKIYRFVLVLPDAEGGQPEWVLKFGYPIELDAGDDVATGCLPNEKIEIHVGDANDASGDFELNNAS